MSGYELGVSTYDDEDFLEDSPFLTKTNSFEDYPRDLLPSQHASLACYWFGWSFLWLPLLVVIIPLQVFRLAGDEGKGAAMGTSLLLGSFVSVFAAPLFGSLSDHCTHKFGKRRPFMIVGGIISSIALFILAIAPSLWWFSFGFILLSFANNMIVAPYSALVPDLVPNHQRGTASGWLGCLSMLGYLGGGLVSYHIGSTGVFGAYLILIFVHGMSMAYTIYNIEEKQFVPKKPPPTVAERLASVMKPLTNNDFKMVFITRFLMQMGIITVQEYLQFYLKDAIGQPYMISGAVVADTPEKAVSLLFCPVLFGAVVASLAAGLVSDHSGGKRKSIVYLSGTVMAVSCVLFAVTRSYAFDMVLGLVFGVGFGAFSVMDWALVTDVLPDKEEYAKDMGLWSLSLVMPQMVAAPIAGYLLDHFQGIGPDWGLGYTVIFLVSVVYFVAGTYYVKFIEGVE